MCEILYIHGFASCGRGVKSTRLAHRFAPTKVCAPDLPVSPDEAIAFLSELIETRRPSMLVGSSLGGYYATYLAEYFGLKAVLINPSTRPYETLAPFVGENRRFCDNAPFLWRRDYLDSLRKLDTIPSKADYLVLLQSGDEVLDYRHALKRYAAFKTIVESGGSHRFENIDAYLDMIERFHLQRK